MTKATHATLVFVKGKGNVGKFTQGRSPPTPILGIHQQARQIMKQINPDHSLHEKNEISLREAISGSFGPWGISGMFLSFSCLFAFLLEKACNSRWHSKRQECAAILFFEVVVALKRAVGFESDMFKLVLPGCDGQAGYPWA